MQNKYKSIRVVAGELHVDVDTAGAPQVSKTSEGDCVLKKSKHGKLTMSKEFDAAYDRMNLYKKD